VLLMAVQPAIVEELFFRYFALNALRDAAGPHAAVWVSAVMFALAHVYNPLGLPWLLVAGVVWGYWRVASGGLALTMLLHFTHNALMLWTQGLL
jgi:membrane protease YdiL (CAAX protease family)